ncbi:hypothetical protein JXA40_06490 [bacterium]|nr:hypothetical protein [candidate division CSSED10-310 bacterium]
MEIILDTFGSDYGPEFTIQAGVRAVESMDIHIAFAGNRSVILDLLAKAVCSATGRIDENSFRIVEADQWIRMDEDPGSILRDKPEASIVRCIREVAQGRSQAVVSAGNTGAVVLAAREILGLLPSIRTPGLCQLMPGPENRDFLLLDVGASISLTALDYVNFGILGYAAARTILDIPDPRIGLLNVGSERNKGPRRLRKAGAILETLPLEFRGNVEGNDMWTGISDVYVTDGITGNIVLKSSESLARMIFKSMGIDFSGDRVINKRFDPSQYGGAILMGANGICMVCHGKAGVENIYNAIGAAKKWHERTVLDNTLEVLNRMGRS